MGQAMDSPEIGKRIAVMQAEYAAKLPARIAEIEQRWDALLAAGLPAAELEELVRTVHGIAGSGAIFGLAAVSGAARELELYLESIRARGGPAGTAESERVAALIAAIKDAAG